MGERVDKTAAAARARRYRARKRRDAATVTPGVTLSAAALLAEKEARAVLGSDFDRLGTAVRMYVLAVDVADHAHSVWEAEDRPMRDATAGNLSANRTRTP